MPGCVLHVVGETFEPTDVLQRLSFEPYSVFNKGDKRFPASATSGKLHSAGGFKCDLSRADGNLAQQVQDAIEFLARHFNDLNELRCEDSIQVKCLSFGYYFRPDNIDAFVQSDSLPVELLRLCAELRISIELSLYPHPID